MLDLYSVLNYNRGMNKLSTAQRAQILRLLTEGMSIRSTSRVTGTAVGTIMKLLVEAGEACGEFHDRYVRGIQGHRRIQLDEIWAFCYTKQKHVEFAQAAPEGAGDVWTWTALDSDSKLLVSWLVGGRDGGYALAMADDLRSRLEDRPQITSDGHAAYLEGIEGAFGGDVDYAQQIKVYATASVQEQRRYSPAHCIDVETKIVTGNPDESHISTSHVERQNLTMRMSMRRLTRLTNAFSKKLQNHMHAVALHVVHYNFCRLHKTLGQTPAMAAGLAEVPLPIESIVDLIDVRNPGTGPRGPYRKRQEAAISN